MNSNQDSKGTERGLRGFRKTGNGELSINLKQYFAPKPVNKDEGHIVNSSPKGPSIDHIKIESAVNGHRNLPEKNNCITVSCNRFSKPLFLGPSCSTPPKKEITDVDTNGTLTSPSSSCRSTPCKSELTDSQDCPLVIRGKIGGKYRRIVTDDDDDMEEGIAEGEKETQNDMFPGDKEVEDYLIMWDSVYPLMDKMEIMDIFRDCEWNKVRTADSLEQMDKERKKEMKMKEQMEMLRVMKDNAPQLNGTQRSSGENGWEMDEETSQNDQVRPTKMMLLTQRHLAEKAKKTAKMAAFKAKGAISKYEQDYDEDEEDYVGKAKVYESDDSETEMDFEMTSDRKIVLQFFNEATLPELTAIKGCSVKKAEVIVSARPYVNWQDVVHKFQTEKGINTDLLNAAKNILHVRATVQRLMIKCERIASQLQVMVTSLISGEEDGRMARQPDNMSNDLTMKNYQLIGLNWLIMMDEKDLNGVLADEMGLGKTVQAISFLAYLKEQNISMEGAHLVIVPSSTLDNWAREFELWCPSLVILCYHGSQEERRGIRCALFNNELEEEPDVILTTYNMVISSVEDRQLFKRMVFHTVIFDEAHMLKNMASHRYENLMKIKAYRRLLLTGTPLQNNLVELMSILIFVMPQLFEGKKEELTRVFSMFPKSETAESKGRFELERIEQAKNIMKPFFLRRLKSDVLKDLPPKVDRVIHVAMSPCQRELYNATVAAFSKQKEKLQEELQKVDFLSLDEEQESTMKSLEPSPKKRDKEETPKKNGTSKRKAKEDTTPQKSRKKKKKVDSEEDSIEEDVEDTDTKMANSGTNIVMALRKIANHPLLMRKHYDANKIKLMSQTLKRTTHRDSILQYIQEDLSVMSDFEIHSTCKMYSAITCHALSDEHIVDSGKFRQLDILLHSLKENGSRVLIFSQFVIVLNILSEYLKIRGHRFLRLDGSTQVSERQELIDEFNDSPDIFLFILSTKAGGLGINLTAADTVILHDIDFNPYNDKQAEDRCHRVGQTSTVTVIRLISQDSIEEGMWKIAQKKLLLEKQVTGRGDSKRGEVETLLQAALLLHPAEDDEDETSSIEDAKEERSPTESGEVENELLMTPYDSGEQTEESSPVEEDSSLVEEESSPVKEESPPLEKESSPLEEVSSPPIESTENLLDEANTILGGTDMSELEETTDPLEEAFPSGDENQSETV